VRRTYKKLPGLVGQTREELLAIARTPGWQGYMSVPAKATAAYGRDFEAWWVNGLSDLILRAVGGEDLRKAARVPDNIDPVMASTLGLALENEQTFDAKLQDWLARRRQPQR
jgi:hypothetical protein